MTDNRTTELLPCPFCGGEVKLTTYRDEGWEIKCENHDWPNATWEHPLKASDIAADVGMYTWGLGEDAKAALIAAWNARYHCGLTDEDYNILLDELGVSERTCSIVEYDEAPFPVCSKCGAVQPDDFTVYYCWNCGARVIGMEVGE